MKKRLKKSRTNFQDSYTPGLLRRSVTSSGFITHSNMETAKDATHPSTTKSGYKRTLITNPPINPTPLTAAPTAVSESARTPCVCARKTTPQKKVSANSEKSRFFFLFLSVKNILLPDT